MKLQTRALSFAVALLALPLVISSCSETDLAGRILFVEAEGTITGLVFLDRNGNEGLDAFDDRVEGLEVSLFVAGTQSLTASAITDENGIFLLGDVPVGRHRLEVEAGDRALDPLGELGTGQPAHAADEAQECTHPQVRVHEAGLGHERKF